MAIKKATYKLKHLPTGLYYQPGSGQGSSNLSERGKVYSGPTSVLSKAIANHQQSITIQVTQQGRVYEATKAQVNYRTQRNYYNVYVAETKVSDWVKEEVVVLEKDTDVPLYTEDELRECMEMFATTVMKNGLIDKTYRKIIEEAIDFIKEERKHHG